MAACLPSTGLDVWLSLSLCFVCAIKAFIVARSDDCLIQQRRKLADQSCFDLEFALIWLLVAGILGIETLQFLCENY